MAKVDYFDFQWQRPKLVLQLSPLDAQQLLRHPRGQWSTSERNCIADVLDVRSGLLLIPSNTDWETVDLMNSKNIIEKFAIRNPSIRQITNLVKKFGRMRNFGKVDDEIELVQTRISADQNLIDSYLVEDIDIWMENIGLFYAVNSIYNYKIGVVRLDEFLFNMNSMKNRTFSDRILRDSVIDASSKSIIILDKIENGSESEADEVLKELYLSTYEKILDMKLSNIDIRVTWKFGNDGSLKTYVKPKNLEDALWLAFAQYASGAAQLRQCAKCGKVYPHRGHKDRQYCGDACRQAASRFRRGL